MGRLKFIVTLVVLMITGIGIVYFNSPYLGGTHAVYLRGNCYYFGMGGFPQDFKKAREWLTKAAEAGHPKAQTNLGHLYKNGEGGPVDLAEAQKWWTMAASQGYSLGMYNLACLLENPNTTSYDATEALRLFRAAAEDGLPHCQARLGQAYLDGWGVATDPVKAFEWFSKAAEGGFPKGCQGVGELLMRGRGVPQDKVEGLAWIMLSGNRPAVDQAKLECTEDERRKAVKRCSILSETTLRFPYEISLPQTVR